jgi:hypothetical protein
VGASRDATGVDELGFLAVTEGTVLDQTLGNGSITESFIHLTGEELQKEGFSITGLIGLAQLGKSCSHCFKEREGLSAFQVLGFYPDSKYLVFG